MKDKLKADLVKSLTKDDVTLINFDLRISNLEQALISLKEIIDTMQRPPFSKVVSAKYYSLNETLYFSDDNVTFIDSKIKYNASIPVGIVSNGETIVLLPPTGNEIHYFDENNQMNYQTVQIDDVTIFDNVTWNSVSYVDNIFIINGTENNGVAVSYISTDGKTWIDAYPVGNMSEITATPGDQSLTLEWNEVTNATSYEVYLSTEDTMPSTPTQIVT